MKFLSKLFGKGSDADPPEPSAKEAPVQVEPDVAQQEETGDTPEQAPAQSEDEAGAEVPDPAAAELQDSAAADLHDPAAAERAEQPASDPSEEAGSADLDAGEAGSDLRLRLQREPRDEQHHEAVNLAFPGQQQRIEFYQDLLSVDPEQSYHGVSLGRAYRGAGQFREAIPHYQLYLRSEMDADIFEELADVYDAAGEAYLASSARQIAQSVRSKGV